MSSRQVRRGCGALALACVAGGCGYRSGSFAGPTGAFAGEQVTVGCLDLAVSKSQDAAAAGPVIAYHFGNRCDSPATIDLAAVVVTGRTVSGREVALAPYDPYGELHAARIEARRTGREVIEYVSPDVEELTMACVDLIAVAGALGPEGDARREVCFDVGSHAAVAEVSP